jgi:hypothetical protein
MTVYATDIEWLDVTNAALCEQAGRPDPARRDLPPCRREARPGG